MPKTLSVVFAALLVTGCKGAINDLLDLGPTPIGPQSVLSFNGIGTIQVGDCRVEGPIHVSSDLNGHRYMVSTDNFLEPEQLLKCGHSSTGYNTPMIFEAEVTAHTVGGRLEIGAPTGPQPGSGPFLMAVTPQDTEVQAQLAGRPAVTERNRVLAGLYGDNWRVLRLTVTLDPVGR